MKQILLSLKRGLEKERHYALILAITLGVCFWHYKGDYWFSRWTVVLLIASGFLAYNVKVAVNSIPAGLWTFWTLAMGLWAYSWKDNYYRFLSAVMQCTYDPNRSGGWFDTTSPKACELEASTAYTAVCFLLLVTSVVSITPQRAIDFMKALRIAAVSASVFIIGQYLLPLLFPTLVPPMVAQTAGLFFNQPSLEGCFIAIVYPLIILMPMPPSKSQLGTLVSSVEVFSPPIALAILCAEVGASQPLTILAATCAFGILARPLVFKVGKKIFLLDITERLGIVITLGLVAFLFGLKVNPDFMNSNGRFAIYKMTYEFFTSRWEFLTFGLGTGSFWTWGPMLQTSTNTAVHNSFTWLHSDIFEIVFGQGLIGGGLMLLTGFQAFYRAWRSPVYWAGLSFLAYCLAMVFNLPMHHPILAFLGLFLLAVCLRCRYSKATP